jgi:1,4-dihydroxy-2-naphthoate octaprenyltransferase
MADGDKSAHVTRREFYNAQAFVWFCIMLALGDLVWREERWTTLLLCGVSMLMALVYTVMSLSARRSSSGGDTGGGSVAAPDRGGR